MNGDTIMQNPLGGSMRRRALLAILVVLLLIGAYGAYVVSYPKYPEVKGCVNPFAVTKPVSKVQENWSEVHVFFKLVTTRDFWKLAKPWDVDYSHVKVVKHTIEYNGEKVTMLAMGIPLKDKKHVIALYEFSKPVQGVKIFGVEYAITGNIAKANAVYLNGKLKKLDSNSCSQECQSNSDCGFLGQCHWYCCKFDIIKAAECCGICGDNIVCIATWCAFCIYESCYQWGSYCQGWTPGP